MRRFLQYLAVGLLLLPLVVGAETITWQAPTTWEDGTTVSATDKATFTYYIRAGIDPGGTFYIGEARNGITTWADNILVKMNQMKPTTVRTVVAGDNVYVTLSTAFKWADGTEHDSPQSPTYKWTIPGGVVIVAPAVTLAAAPASVIRGSCSTLTWSSTNATAASIDQGIGAVATTGTRSVCPTAGTTYTLTATGPGGTTTKTAAVAVTIPVQPGCTPPTNINITK